MRQEVKLMSFVSTRGIFLSAIGRLRSLSNPKQSLFSKTFSSAFSLASQRFHFQKLVFPSFKGEIRYFGHFDFKKTNLL